MTKPLFSSLRNGIVAVTNRFQRGASMIETIVVFPVLFLVGAGILHIALIAQAKSNLEYASLMAARIASSTPNFGFEADGLGAVEEEVLTRMEASDPRNGEFAELGIVRVCVLRPSDAAFVDFGQANIVPGSVAIPNDNVPFLNQNDGTQSGITVQDANLLHLRVSYLFDTKVPFLGSLDYGDNSGGAVIDPPDEVGEPLSGEGERVARGIWISADAVVVMQTPALLNDVTSPHIEGTSDFEPCP